jgi:hypothetical protein
MSGLYTGDEMPHVEAGEIVEAPQLSPQKQEIEEKRARLHAELRGKLETANSIAELEEFKTQLRAASRQLDGEQFRDLGTAGAERKAKLLAAELDNRADVALGREPGSDG